MALGCTRSSLDASSPKNGTILLPRSMHFKGAARAANRGTARAARADFGQEGFGRHRRQEELEEARAPRVVEAKVRGISNVSTVENLGIIRVTALTSRSVITVAVEVINPQIAPTLRKATPIRPHPETGKEKEKESME